MKILVVDDQEENRYLLEMLLQGHGHEVQVARHGAEAMERLLGGPVDLIVSDILMPVMDGFQLCRTIKKDDKLRTIPFIFHTATYTGPQDETFALKLGADRFLRKPCEPEELTRVIDEVTACGHRRRDVVEEPDEEELLVLYNERLVRKLEQKMAEAEREIEERRQVELRLREAYQIINMSPVVAFLWENAPARPVEFVSDNVLELFGYPVDDFVSGRISYFKLIHADDRTRVADEVDKIVRSREKNEYRHEPYRLVARDGKIKWIDQRTNVRRDSGGAVSHLQAIVIDITEIKTIEAQLFQAQKMESIGRLAGGVAHDYNNMLSVIIGYSELALSRVASDDPLREDLQEILTAAGRSRDITRQLLAFARKETILPEVLDVNEVVGAMLKVLRRLIGEDVDLAWMPGAGLWPVRMDPAQIGQILANLCVNARDAIADVGKITIETKAVRFDEAYCAGNVDFVPGEFVLLSVADDGCGMDRQTREQIFEPFFTTKEPGLGTGLGLSMVYGIVKQNEGHINVYSEPGQGTVFKIYLPRCQEEADHEEPDHLEAADPGGTGEMIMVVEDEISIMRLTQRILESLNYRVLTAQTTTEALQLAERHAGTLSLLITDVVMPEMNGRELAERIQQRCQKLACLFMSGYTADVVVHRGVLDQNVHFLQKPFSKNDLAKSVRAALGTD